MILNDAIWALVGAVATAIIAFVAVRRAIRKKLGGG
jgi:uncharacterized membrane protein YdjX (TVP38/TMEM64 family)